uniref:F-box domain-containing protein n=1 Tax=Steinernema glaseri TaxID=37863 RepID=A0A1I8ARA1_9BILA
MHFITLTLTCRWLVDVAYNLRSRSETRLLQPEEDVNDEADKSSLANGKNKLCNSVTLSVMIAFCCLLLADSIIRQRSYWLGTKCVDLPLTISGGVTVHSSPLCLTMEETPFAFFDNLPDHLIVQTFRELFFDDILNCMLTCRRWKRLIYSAISYEKDEDIEVRYSAILCSVSAYKFRIDVDLPKTQKQRLGRCQLAICTCYTEDDAEKERRILEQIMPEFFSQPKFTYLISLSLLEVTADHLKIILGCVPRLKELSIYKVNEVRPVMLQTLLTYIKGNVNLQRLSFLQQPLDERYDVHPFDYSKFTDVFINRHQFQLLRMCNQPILTGETLPMVIKHLLEWPRLCYVMSLAEGISLEQIVTSYPSFKPLNLQRCDCSRHPFATEQNFLKLFWYEDELWLVVTRLFEQYSEIECSKAEDSLFFTEYIRMLGIPKEVSMYKEEAPVQFAGERPGPKERLPFGHRYAEGALEFVAHVRSEEPDVYEGYTWIYENFPVKVTLTTSSKELPGVCYNHPLLNSEIVGTTVRSAKKKLSDSFRPLMVANLREWQRYELF